MKTPYAFFVLFFFTITCWSQQQWSGIVVSNTNEPVAFATIQILPRGYLYTTDEAGKVSISYNTSDTIRVSCLGYKGVNLLAQNLAKTSEIRLKAVVFELDEVKIRPTETKKEWVGAVGKPVPRFNIGLIPGASHAVYIPNNERKTGIISKVRYNFKSFFLFPKEDVPFKIHLYTVGKNGEPDKELMPEVILVKPNSRRWFVVDISQYQIEVPENGFFVAMQSPTRQEYQYKYRKGTYKRPDGTVNKNYQIEDNISVAITDEFDNKRTWWKSTNKDKWIQSNYGFKVKKRDGSSINLMFGAEVEWQ